MSSKSDAASPAAKPGDKIGAFPRDYDTDALPERRTAALARMLAIVATVEAFALAGMGFALAAITPLQKVVPMVVTSNKMGDEIVHINPATLESPTVDYVTEIELRKFVQSRYSISSNPAEQANNLKIIQLMSTTEDYNKYLNQQKPEYARLRTESKIRTVRIDSVRKLSPDTWQVEYVTNDSVETNPMQGASPTEQHAWVSTYSVAFSTKNVRYEERLNNPFGMTVKASNDARRD